MLSGELLNEGLGFLGVVDRATPLETSSVNGSLHKRHVHANS